MRRIPRSTERFASFGLFERCTSHQLAYVNRLSTMINVPAAREVCRQGEVGREFFIVLDGALAVVRSGAILAIIGAGDWLGELALTAQLPRTASACTLRSSALLVFNTREYRTLRRVCPTVADTIDLATPHRLASLRVGTEDGTRLEVH